MKKKNKKKITQTDKKKKINIINMKLGEWRKAVNSYESLLGVYPHSPDAKTYLPVLKRKLGEIEL